MDAEPPPVYDYTAFPSAAFRSRFHPIDFSEKSEARVLHALGDWWNTTELDGAFNPSVEFQLPSKKGNVMYDISLHFVRYDHPDVIARLHIGIEDEPVLNKDGFPVLFHVVRHPRGTKASNPLEPFNRVVDAAEGNTRSFIEAADEAMDALVIQAEREDAEHTRGRISMVDMMGNDMGYGDAAVRIIRYATILMKGADAIYKAYKRSKLYVEYYDAPMWARLQGQAREKVAPFYERLLAEGFKPDRLHDTVVLVKRANKKGVRATTRLPGDLKFDARGAKRTQSEDDDEDIFNTPVEPFSRKNLKLTPEREQNLDALISTLVSAIEASIGALPVGASPSPSDALPEIPIECNSCGKATATHRCARCKTAHYCGRACQLSHWGKGHSAVCKSK